uniref:Uncharacterized protein n=1 Tax=Palpitomonas bilix TaxID=652834 RepID=A0A7S3GM27_9EUKA|mmetsp:Transcript_9507/g.25801  ORF Transcript_9507/g.25801 Transcript_9507/m.25801 type:complete len:106 (+) Transcript_9507:25-342(+)
MTRMLVIFFVVALLVAPLYAIPVAQPNIIQSGRDSNSHTSTKASVAGTPFQCYTYIVGQGDVVETCPDGQTACAGNLGCCDPNTAECDYLTCCYTSLCNKPKTAL